MRNTTAMALLASLAAAGPAAAQDFNGAYFGVFGTMSLGALGSWSEQGAYDEDWGFLYYELDTTLSGHGLGVTAGFDTQVGNIIYGGQLSLYLNDASTESYGDFVDEYSPSGSGSGGFGDFGDGAFGGDFVEGELMVEDSLRTIAGVSTRVGVLAGPRTAVFGTVGMYMGQFERTASMQGIGYYQGPLASQYSVSETVYGPGVGVAVEHMLTDNLSLSAAATYINYGTVQSMGIGDYATSSGSGSGGSDVTYQEEVDLEDTILTIGVNYRF